MKLIFNPKLTNKNIFTSKAQRLKEKIKRIKELRDFESLRQI